MPIPDARAAALLVCLGLGLLARGPASAQDSLLLTNDSTAVRKISFRFSSGNNFDPNQLMFQLVTRAPSTWDRMKARLPFLDEPLYVLDPIELQRDVARLRRFYRRNGFLEPDIDYPATQFDASSNRIHIIFTIREGPPLSVANRRIAIDSTLPAKLTADWENYSGRLPLGRSDRYTEFERLRMESLARSWWRDRGYAFADVQSEVAIDSTANRVDLGLRIDPGPLARFTEIEIEGNSTVKDGIIRRQLPFREGDLFSSIKLLNGQRALFGLNLFRVALAEVPSQPRDSTVLVRLRVREARPRYIAATTGFSQDEGLSLDGDWRHRNFYGGARQLSISTSVRTGWLASPGDGRVAVRSLTNSVTLRQPYFFVRKLSGSIGAYFTLLDDRNLQTRYYEFGSAPAVVYEFLPFRTGTLQYSLSRAVPIGGASTDITVYDRSVITTGATVGRLNNYLNPRRGYIIRPTIEVAGLLASSDIEYLKGTISGTAYIPLTRRSSAMVSVNIGRLSPRGRSRNQNDPNTEYRFDPIRFYAGGANDVRGWSLNELGPQIIRSDSVYVDSDGNPQAAGAGYESIGALGKVSGSFELRVPIPWFDNNWRLGAFLDAGGLSARVLRDAAGRVLLDGNNQPLVRDRAMPALGDFQFGTGLGLRFQTPVGSIRFDVAYKLNPRNEDLRDPAEMVLFEAGVLSTLPRGQTLRRFNIHLSIDRAF